MLGVSRDDEVSHQAFKSKFNLPFTLLVDADHKVMDLYGAWGPRPNGGEGTIRSSFVIDEQGNLIDVQLPVTPNDSVSTAMEKLRA